MTSDTRVPATKITGLYGAIIKTVARRMLGRVPDSLGVLWQHQSVMKDTMSLGRKVEGWHELAPDLASYAGMAAAATIGCSFCLDFNYFMAHNHGLDDAKVREVPRWRESTVFTPLERRVMEYAEAATQTPPAVSDELSAALLEDLGPAALIELAARVGVMNLTARSNVALGIHSEEFAAACGLAPLAVASAVSAPAPAAAVSE